MKKSIYKTISWITITTTMNIFLVYIFTKRLDISLGIGAINIVLKFTGYYIHERMWKRITIR